MLFQQKIKSSHVRISMDQTLHKMAEFSLKQVDRIQSMNYYIYHILIAKNCNYWQKIIYSP